MAFCNASKEARLAAARTSQQIDCSNPREHREFNHRVLEISTLDLAIANVAQVRGDVGVPDTVGSHEAVDASWK